MKRIFVGISLCLLPVTCLHAQSQSVCKNYQDQIVEPITIDAALLKFKNAQIAKDEFETTAQFQARQSSAIGGAVSPLIISKHVDQKYIKYNADSQEFTIETYLFDNENMDYEVLGYPSPLPNKEIGNIDVVITETESVGGTYIASNSYGAKTTVSKILRTTKGIFDKPSPSIIGNIFNTGREDSTLISLKLTPEKAREIKPLLKIAFLVVPKAPFIVHGSGKVGKTTIDSPLDVTNDLTVLTADIQCGFLTDSSNKVLGSFPTN